MARVVRLAAVSHVPPFHPHRTRGVDLEALRGFCRKLAVEEPDFVCFPEICACAGVGLEAAAREAPDSEVFLKAGAALAREFRFNLVLPFLERKDDRIYNAVPVFDRRGEVAMVYRKNYPTVGEMEAGITPGTETPVVECDGVRVGAAVCFDLNYEDVAARLEAARARLVFWPSMYWGGRLLEFWALRRGFVLVSSHLPESRVVDMNGRVLAARGTSTPQVAAGFLPPWAIAEVNLDKELFHLDSNQNKFAEMSAKLGAGVAIESLYPEAFCVVENRLPGRSVEDLAREHGLETLRDYLARSARRRENALAAAHLPDRA